MKWLSKLKEKACKTSEMLTQIPCTITQMFLIRLSTEIALNGYSSQLRGRVLESRPRGRGFEPHRRHCVVSLSKRHLSLLSTGSTQENLSVHNKKLLTGM